jgi:hypothetical protein
MTAREAYLWAKLLVLTIIIAASMVLPVISIAQAL